MAEKREVCNIALGTIIKGDLRSENHIRLEGTVEGHVYCKGRLVLSDQGRITGNIECETAFIEGSVEGNMQVTTELHLSSTARVIGDVSCTALQVELGATLLGNCSMPKK